MGLPPASSAGTVTVDIFSSAMILLVLCMSHALAAGAGAAYVPTDSILLNSGSTEDAADADGRTWLGDQTKNKNSFLSSGESRISTAAQQDPSLPSPVPYMTARIFTEAATFEFPVSAKTQHFLRLHFYPATYDGLDPACSFFDVTVAGGGITLLRNFSAYANAEALTQAYLIREFYLPPAAATGGTLRLTFTPSAARNGSFAFVNGIEVLSAPDVYGGAASLVGFSGEDVAVGGSSLQTMFRLNVGGQFLPPGNDTGLGRTWYDDSPYIFGAAVGITYPAADNVTIRFPSTAAKMAAPVDVYGSARSMGPDPQVNLNTNLTWVFQVDAGFTYLVRLHFCELQMSKLNQRVFDVYVNNQTATAGADVIGWAAAPAVPTFQDYTVYVAGGPGAAELWVVLHPSAASKPEYLDAVLNGLEVLKMNDSAGNLAGLNLRPSEYSDAEKQQEKEEEQFASSGTSSGMLKGAAGGAAALGLVCAICFAAYSRKRRRAVMGGVGSSGGWLPLYGSSTTTSRSTISGKSTASSHLSSLAVSLSRHFSLAEIRQATNNFNEKLVIGVGGFGKVYRGVVDGGTKVAIKRSNPSSEQGVNEFQTEIEMLSKLRHRHLVSLIGYCEEDEEMILVYDYMARGTLREHLYQSSSGGGGEAAPLPWRQRLEICIGAARGLHYLHTGAKYPIIHRDVKTTNILLDERWVAKVSDFGLSKTGPSSLDQTHVSTVVKGSFGYLDPEYFRRQQLTDKSDVYSFGVVLFEVLCARPALNPSLSREQVSLADWALLCKRKGKLDDIIDPALRGKISAECLAKFAATAEKCLSDHGLDRPAMGDVLWNLEFALQLQEAADAGAAPPLPPPGPAAGEHAYAHRQADSIAGSEMSEDSTDGVNPVFSQLINPKGR
ncbi:receptor-like protein kinase ANXUR1 [Wolffia australiana]